jgi:hypothetical protein
MNIVSHPTAYLDESNIKEATAQKEQCSIHEE